MLIRKWRRYGNVGEILGGDGSTAAVLAGGRQAKTGEATVTQVNGKYYELASRGRLAFASDQGAGVANTATSIGTVALLSLYNPVNSGRRIAVCKAWLGYLSGTYALGPIFHCVTPQVSGTAQTQPSGGTGLTSYWSDINNLQLSAAPVGLARTASTVVTPIVFAPFAFSGAFAGGANNVLQTCYDDLDGAIVLEPGGSYQIQCKQNTGTSPLVNIGVLWAEIPFVASQG